jgi:hypothetical protein|tara:strand:- start:148 stop:753 length:606 start_codon:yes stop_codon:yes gene_type:complete
MSSKRLFPLGTKMTPNCKNRVHPLILIQTRGVFQTLTQSLLILKFTATKNFVFEIINYVIEIEVIGDEAEAVILGKNEIKDERIRTILRVKSNFTVLLESTTYTGLYLGSGFLICNYDHSWVLTAAHCVATLENGEIEKMLGVRLRLPVLPNYNDDGFPHARHKKDDHRFKNYIINNNAIHIYPIYIEDESSRGGTDVGMF